MLNKTKLKSIAKLPSISDMAESYGRLHQGTVDIEVFQDGANAVLERLESSIKTMIEEGDLRSYLPVHSLMQRINQLKGK